jgi:hypothetical protein
MALSTWPFIWAWYPFIQSDRALACFSLGLPGDSSFAIFSPKGIKIPETLA